VTRAILRVARKVREEPAVLLEPRLGDSKRFTDGRIATLELVLDQHKSRKRADQTDEYRAEHEREQHDESLLFS
jgi:hypothetical protein